MRIGGQVFKCQHCQGYISEKCDINERNCFVRNTEKLLACINCGRRYCLSYNREDNKYAIKLLY